MKIALFKSLRALALLGLSIVFSTAGRTAMLSKGPLVQATVEVPRGLASEPFDQARQLHIPTGFGIRVIARLPGARFIAATPDGNFLVSEPESGKLVLVKPNAGKLPQVTDFAVDLNVPHDMVFHRDGNSTWLYVSETNQISRYAWTDGMAVAGAQQIVVADLPNRRTAGLSGYVHPLKNIAVSPAGKLFVAIASTCNACAEDMRANPVRGSIYVYDLDGKNGRLYARGLRNAEGLDFRP
ncbi:MAG TPA: hypothetical protein VFW00_12415, partial [Rhodocyclaceae bacterium]|nr:hypothetical protein [Rhodocyclaceae bacterium]